MSCKMTLSLALQPWTPWWHLPEAAALQLSRTGEPLVQPQGMAAPGMASQACLRTVPKQLARQLK